MQVERERTSALHGELGRRLEQCLVGAGTQDSEKTMAAIEGYDSARWASATFEGHRHRFTLRFVKDQPRVAAAVTLFRGEIVGEGIRLRGELLADVALVGEDDMRGANGGTVSRLHYEALTIRD